MVLIKDYFCSSKVILVYILQKALIIQKEYTYNKKYPSIEEGASKQEEYGWKALR